MTWRQVIIAQSETHTITSHGNGAAYTFANTATGESVFIQGDIASSFRDELHAVEASESALIRQKGALAWLWDECAWGDASEGVTA